jgi:hypothetical protein
MATPIWLDFLCPNAHLLIIDRLSEPSSTAMLKLWRSSLDGHVRKYRPEDHYMRGPGPKWQQKHDLSHGLRSDAFCTN